MTFLKVTKTNDFEVTGDGNSAPWKNAAWAPMSTVSPTSSSWETKAKALYSETGIYFLVDCEDQKLSCTMTRDMDDLFKEDVVEVMLWTHEASPVYLEYEISPLNFELPIMVTNFEGSFHGWLPWHYDLPRRRTRHATIVRGGEKSPGSSVTGWSCEFFIPFALLHGVGNVPPQAGTKWRANIYRIDYDQSEPIQWAWCSDTKRDFHDYKNFGTLVFE